MARSDDDLNPSMGSPGITTSGPFETGPNAGAGPGGPEPDEDDDRVPGSRLDPDDSDRAGPGEPPERIGETEVIRTGVGGPGPGGVTTQDLDAGRGPSGVGPDDQPTAED